MLPVLLVVAGLFCALLLLRLGGAQRAELAKRWPAFLFAGAALAMLLRGSFWTGAVLLGAAVVMWFLSPQVLARRSNRTEKSPVDPADTEAFQLLGLRDGASHAEIRAAYRHKMAQAHPDRGGSNAAAARLTAARDRLLRKAR